jgi:predicted GNAT family acetyltransferase
MGTKLDGVWASQACDSSGEILSVSGIDTSSMQNDGVVTWEHNGSQASQIIGRVKYTKKIFSEADCDTDRQRHYWNKTEMPFLYGIAELFDSEGHSGAKDVSAILKYNKQNASTDSSSLLGWSIEGAKISKDGMQITKSIGRNVSLTVKPCNKTCILGEYVEDTPKKSTLGLSFIKSEGNIMSDNDYKETMIQEMLKQEPTAFVKQKLQNTLDLLKAEKVKKSNEGVNPIGMPMMYSEKMNKDEPKKPAEAPAATPPADTKKVAIKLSKPKKSFVPKVKVPPQRIHSKLSGGKMDYLDAAGYKKKMEEHQKKKAKIRENPQGFSGSAPAATTGAHLPAVGESDTKFRIKKAEAAGSAAGAPSTLTGTAALAKSPFSKKHVKMNELYKTWEHKDEFHKFIKKHFPDMSDKEAQAFAKLFKLVQTERQENKLKNMIKFEELEKGQKGDWKKEGYSLHHEHLNDKSMRVYALPPGQEKFIPGKGFAGVAHLKIDRKNKTLEPLHTQVDEKHQRKGIASALYQHAEKVSKDWKEGQHKVIPGRHQSEDAKKLWQSKEDKKD